jgi:pimeloyl-ACP methyl ester carboxylesterase
MQYYARNYRNEVAGLVLVDSTHWSQVPRSRSGPRLAGVPGVLMCSMTPTACAEFDGIELSGQQVQDSQPLQEMPFVVISAGMRAEQVRPAPKLITVPVNDEIDAMQRDLAQQLPDSKHVLAMHSGHYVQNTEPGLIVDALRDLTAQLADQ